MMFSGLPAGGGTSALLAQYLGADFDWRQLFVIGGVLPFLLVPGIYFLLPETRPRDTLNRDSPADIAHALFKEGRFAPTLLL